MANALFDPAVLDALNAMERQRRERDATDALARRYMGTIGPIERRGLLAKGLGAYGDVLDSTAGKVSALASWFGSVPLPKNALYAQALQSIATGLKESGGAFRGWSNGFSPFRGDPRNPVVDRNQLVGILGGLPPVAQVARGVPGAVKHAARDFAEATVSGLPHMAARKPVPLYHGSNADFTEFDFNSPSEYVPQSQKGVLWFTTSPEVGRSYGKNLYTAPINLKNPLVVKVKATVRSSGQGKYAIHVDYGDEIGGKWLDSVDYPSKQEAIDALSRAKAEGRLNPTSGLMALAIKKAKEAGRDGVIFKNVDDAYFHDAPPSDVYAVFGSGKMKAERL